MTIGKLHRVLGFLISQGHGRKRVCINKRTFHHNCENDGTVILDVLSSDIERVLLADDDGGPSYRKDGTERHFSALVLKGTLDYMIEKGGH